MDEQKFSKCQMNALVLLRVLIGWHFLYEGVAKMMKGSWSAIGFLSQSKWILAPMFKWIAANPTVLNIVNLMNIYGLIAIGLGLIMGCFTRIASYSGVLLILLYFFCNPPFVGLFYSIPMEGSYMMVNKNLVEAAALLVIAVTGSGKYLGLDHLISKWLKK
jgi:thiosulfate dehydrogenase [quinone] large subunit